VTFNFFIDLRSIAFPIKSFCFDDVRTVCVVRLVTGLFSDPYIYIKESVSCVGFQNIINNNLLRNIAQGVRVQQLQVLELLILHFRRKSGD